MHLTLNAGLRYDVQFLPDPIETDRNNFAPSFGFAYAPGEDVSAEGFNLLNRANPGVPINVFGPGTQPAANFRQPTAAFDPGQFQFGLRLNFQHYDHA